MPVIRGIATFITSPQGIDLPLYSLDAKITDFPQDPTSRTKYIEAVPRAQFCVQLAVNSNYDFGRYRAFAFDISVDGRRCHRQILTKEEYESGQNHWFTEVSEQTARNRDGSLLVRKLEFTKPAFFAAAKDYRYAESGTEQLCTVRVTVWPGKVDGHGDFKKVMDVEALATFIFLYRTRQQINDLDLDPYEPWRTWASTLDRPTRSGSAGPGTSRRQREPSEEGDIEEGEIFEKGDFDSRGLTPDNGRNYDPDTPIPSIEHHEDDWVRMTRPEESRHEDDEEDDYDVISNVGHDQDPDNDDAVDLRWRFPDDEEASDEDFVPPNRGNQRKRRRDSLELGRDLTPRGASVKRQRSVSVKPEPGNAQLDPMTELARRRSELLEPFNRRYRELSPMEDGEHEVVKAKFEKRAQIREEQKRLQRYFDREDRQRRAAAATAPERPNKWSGVNLIDLTGEVSDEE